jgi:hypothetical protein
LRVEAVKLISASSRPYAKTANDFPVAAGRRTVEELREGRLPLGPRCTHGFAFATGGRDAPSGRCLLWGIGGNEHHAVATLSAEPVHKWDSVDPGYARPIARAYLRSMAGRVKVPPEAARVVRGAGSYNSLAKALKEVRGGKKPLPAEEAGESPSRVAPGLTSAAELEFDVRAGDW